MAEALTTGSGGGRPTPFRRRFLIAFSILGVLLVGAATAAVVIGMRGGGGVDTSWSIWHPTASGVAGAQQIADHVQPTYRLNGGKQLVVVRAGEAQLGGLPLNVVITDPAGDIQLVPGHALIYVLCGLGDRCSIKTGKPSVQRSLLLRRESLEIALYTFHYIRGIDSVIALLPPKPGEDPKIAMLYRRDGLKDPLKTPLAQTLGSKPPRPSGIKRKEMFQINRLTNNSLFEYSVQQGQDGSAFLVLQQPS